MTETIRQARCAIDDLTKASTIQALLTVILTIVLAVLVINHGFIPEWLKYAWFALLGVYMELPSPNKKTEQIRT